MTKHLILLPLSTIIYISSAELLKIWNEREAALVAEEGTAMEKTLCGCLSTRPLAVSASLLTIYIMHSARMMIITVLAQNERMIFFPTVPPGTKGGDVG